VLDEVERLLLLWINKRQMAGDSLSESIICEKARDINADLVKDKPSTSNNGETFRASKGWFHNFKARTGVHSVARHGEAASADKRAAKNYIHHFEMMTQRNGFCSHQAFNCDETGLFWKKMPRRTYITQEEKKQTTVDQFLVQKRLRPSDPDAGPSGLQTLPRTERTPESQISDVLMEGDSPSKQSPPSCKPKMST
jgi:hypothetical protein